MHKFNHFPLCLLLATGLLGGCGGGSSSSKPAPAPSSNAASSTAASSVVGIESSSASSLSSSSSSAPASSVAATTRLIMKGTVGADALRGGEVKVVLDAQTFKATVNDQKQYELTLEVANTHLTKPFTAVVTGSGSNQWVQLAALYPSISRLMSLAGPDKILDSTEYLGVNVSPMTTAEFSLIMGKKLSIASDRDREYALLQLDAVDELRRAVYVEKTLTDPNQTRPARFPTSLAMWSDYEYTRGQVNILKAQNFDFNEGIRKLQADPLQVRIPGQPLSGKYLISGDQYTYLLDIKLDGTGSLLMSNYLGEYVRAEDGQSRESTFTWVRQLNEIKLTFDSSVDFGKNEEYSELYPQLCVADSEQPDIPGCTVKVDGIVLLLFSENEVGNIANVSVNASVINRGDNKVSNVIVDNGKNKLFNIAKFYKFNKEELYGYDWYSSAFSYLFKANGLVTLADQINKNEQPISWSFEDGIVKLGEDGSFLLPIYPIGPGFVGVELVKRDGSRWSSALSRQMVIKQAGITMAASDWVGRWNRISNSSFYSAVDYFSDYVFRDGFEAQGLGSWSVVSSSHVRGFSNGSWQMEHELLAIHDGQHYMQYCYGIRDDYRSFTPLNCILEAYVIDKTFTGTTFWEVWSNPLFQEAGSLKFWRFSGYKLERDGAPQTNYERVAANMFYDPINGKVLEMLSSSQNAIEVCEYDALTGCGSGTVYNLTRGLEVTINNVYNGSYSFKEITMFPRGSDFNLTLRLVPGYNISVGSVGSCGGVLITSNIYKINARDSDCEITVNYTSAP